MISCISYGYVGTATSVWFETSPFFDKRPSDSKPYATPQKIIFDLWSANRVTGNAHGWSKFSLKEVV